MKNVRGLEKRIGYTFKDKTLLRDALTHPSAEKENIRFEQFEFLGDRVLGLCVATLLSETFSLESEGSWAQRFAALVSREACGTFAKEIDLASYVVFKGKEELSDTSILTDAAEALIAAIYLDVGWKGTFSFVKKFWTKRLEQDISPPKDARSELQEWAQSNKLPLPHYRVRKKTGLEHAPLFEIELNVQGYMPVIAEGNSKRQGSQNAAKKFLDEKDGFQK